MAKFGSNKYGDNYLEEYEEEIEIIREERMKEFEDLDYDEVKKKDSDF